jgi:hypothetical protein
MSQPKSRRIGTRNEEGLSFNPVRAVMVYEALEPLHCGRCGRTIEAGALFARSGRKGNPDGDISERCGRCAGLSRA